MKNKEELTGSNIPLPSVIRFNTDFILEECGRIKTTDVVRNKVIEICSHITTEILPKLGEDDENMRKETLRALSRFDGLIRELKNDENEKDMLFLLTSCVGDMLCAILKRN